MANASLQKFAAVQSIVLNHFNLEHNFYSSENLKEKTINRDHRVTANLMM
tara:strand:- start:91 stop:240 length:150 start_codon:yes stop_codon:yes gene_type:complete